MSQTDYGYPYTFEMVDQRVILEQDLGVYMLQDLTATVSLADIRQMFDALSVPAKASGQKQTQAGDLWSIEGSDIVIEQDTGWHEQRDVYFSLSQADLEVFLQSFESPLAET